MDLKALCAPYKVGLTKTLRIMKLTAIILLSACLTASAKGFSQKVTLSAKDAPLETVIQQIKKQTGYSFFYNVDWLQKAKTITVDIKNVDIEKALDIVFKNQPLSYKLINSTIVLELKDAVLIKDEIPLPPPPITVKGRVINENGEPVRVTVTVKGTNIAVSTNDNGEFVIENVEENATLIFTGVSIEKIEIEVAGKTNLETIKVKTSVKALDVVIINKGYYTEKQRQSTGNVSSISSKELQKQNINNPLQGLQGRMAGVYIQQSTGVPGGGIDIQIRGQNSLRNGRNGTTNGNLPLYVVDGVPFTSSSLTTSFTSGSNLRGGNPLSTINPNDIESIEVLKDADATAIYGSRGANGVVLITTKKAKEGKARVIVDINYGIGKVPKMMKLLNTEQYLGMRREAIRNDGYEALLNDPNPVYDLFWPDLRIWDTTKYTDWQKELIGGTAKITNAQASISGGNAKTQFLFGSGFYSESTVFPGNNHFQRAFGKMNINHESENKRFKFNSSINYSVSLSTIPSTDFTAQAVSLPPNAPSMYDENGKINFEQDTWVNPLLALVRKYDNRIENLVTSASVSYEPITDLHLKANFGYTSMNTDEIIIDPLTAYSPQYLSFGITGTSYFGEGKINTWIAEPQIDYSKTIGKGKLSMLFGTTFQNSTQSGKTIEASGYTNDALLENIAAAKSINIFQVNYYQYRYVAAFARINYNLKEKYIVNLTARRDGSSRFGPGFQFANFGAFGAAWIFSNEKFMSAVPILSFGKLRMSYGSTGSDAIGNYQYLETYSPTTYPYAGATGLSINRLANPDYSWEANRKLEVGLDIGMFKDRLMISTAFYRNRSLKQLIGLPLPVMTGQSTVQFNLPAIVQNKGLEFELSTTWFNSERFQWLSNFNLTIPSNKLLEFPDLSKFPAFASRYEIGSSVYILKGFQFKNVDPQTGVYSFADLNNDGLISSPSDLVGLKSVSQKYYGGIGNSLKYGNFQVDAFLQFVKQTGFNYIRSFFSPGGPSNQPTIVLNRWSAVGNITDIQRFTEWDPSGVVLTAHSLNVNSDNSISDASFVRLKNVSISWSLPMRFLQKLKISGCRIYLQSQNVFTISKYIGLDPENQNPTVLPSLRTLTTGIQVTF